MRVARRVLLAAALTFTCAGSSGSAAERIPTDLAAKRSGVVSQATPSPLNMIFTPIAPCRVFFTPTAIGSNKSRDLQITGSGNLSAQGGPTTGCGVPAYAKAVAINVTAASPANTGTLRLYQTGTARSNFTTLSYGAGANTTSSSIVGLSAGGQLTAYSTALTRVAGDVTGYFEPQLWAYVHSSGSLIDSSGRVTSTSKSATGAYVVNFDRDISYCSVTVSADYMARMASSYTSGTVAYVYMFNADGVSIDYWFNLHVKC